MTKTKNGRPKASAKTLAKNNWYMTKLVFKASPVAATCMALNQLRYALFMFIEHTWLINYILGCVEFNRPFKNAMIAILAVLIGIAVTTVFDAAVQKRMLPKLTLQIETDVKNMIFDKAKDVDLEEFDNPEYYNDFVLTVEKVPMIVKTALTLICNIVNSIGGFITTGVFYYTQNTEAFVIILIASMINLVLYLARSGLYYQKSEATQPHYRKTDYTKRLFYLQDYAKELRLNPDLKNSAFESYDKSFEPLLDEIKKYNKKVLKWGILGNTVSTFIMDVVLVLLLVYQALVLKTIPYSLVVVMINSSYRFRQDIDTLIISFTNTAESCLYVEKILNFIKKKNKIKSDKNLAVDNKPKSIKINDLCFAYNKSDGNILKNISLEIKPKEKIALVGYNGAGKTTLIKLIMRLYDATSGEILQDNINIKDYNVEEYRKSIGVIFQDFNIYAASVKDNVVMDISDDIDDEKIVDSLKSSGFDDKLDELKNGVFTELTTEFDDDGVNLSGGESQKVAISRAFFKKAGLIILDEPSSALDPIAEYNLNNYMLEAAKNSTVIFISHRLSTIRNADRIYMLENGEIIESGSHDELLALNGKYCEMWNTQAGQYN